METGKSIVYLVNDKVWSSMVTVALRSLDIKESIRSSVHLTLVEPVDNSISNIYLSTLWD